MQYSKYTEMLHLYNVGRLTVNDPGPVNVSICVSKSNDEDDCCGQWSSTVQVKFCEARSNDSDHFYVYRLKNVPRCDMAYCADKVSVPHSSKSRLQVLTIVGLRSTSLRPKPRV